MRSFSQICLALTGTVILGVAVATPLLADGHSRKADRQIMVFEKVLNDVLVDSPNFLVQSHDPVVGHMSDGGAVFTFRTSLVGNHWNNHHDDWWKVWRHIDDDDDDRDYPRVFERELKRQERRYTRGKKELVEALGDFGDLLTTLDASDTITLQARLRGAEYFEEEDLRRLVIKVSVRDLRAYGDGQLDEDDFARRVTIDES